jgi:NAD(P)H-dependent FMN reductase
MGSTREGRLGETVAGWFMRNSSERDDLTIELVDLRDWPLPFINQARPPSTGHRDPEAREWSHFVEEADGFILITPEYNFGYPAVLKNALDHLYQEWNGKPVAFVGYGGAAGGARSVQQLRQVVQELQMLPVRDDVILPSVWSLFDDNGRMTTDRFDEKVDALLNSLSRYCHALEPLRATAAAA